MKIAIFVAVIYFMVNIFAVAPTVTIGDTSELTGAAVNYGIAHAPGYPLFCNVYKIFSFIIPFGESGYKLNIASLLLGSLTIAILYLLVFKLTNNNLSSVISVLYLISVDTIIKQNQVGEVFALHNVVIVIMLFVMLATKYSFEKKVWFISFLFGLGMGNQHIILFFVPAIVYWFCLEISRRAPLRVLYRNIWSVLLLSIIFFILGLSIYLFVPLRSLKQPLYDWEDPETVDRLIFLFSRGRYGTLSLAQGGKFSLTFAKLYSGIKMYLHILGTYSSIVFFISLIGIFVSEQKTVWLNIKEKIFFLLGIYFLGPFLITMSGLSVPSPGTVYILERLVASSIIFVAIFVGVCVNDIKTKNILNYALTTVLFYFSIQIYAKNFDRWGVFLYDYVKNIFRNVQYNSLIFSDRADESEFGIAYFQRVLGLRNDIEFIDCNASVTRSIYGNEYYRIWGEPRLKIRTQVESEIIKKTDKPVFYSTVLPNQTGIKKFKFGLLHSVVPLEQKIYSDTFVVRENRVFNPRIVGLQITNLELLGNYYLEQATNDDKMFDLMKKNYDEIFFLTGDLKYRLYVPYYYFSKRQLTRAENEYIKLLNYPLTKDLAKEILNNLGIVCENQKKFSEAEKWYRESIKIDPKFEQAYYNLAVVYWKTQRMDDALKMFNEVLKLNPQNIDAKKYVEYIKTRM